MGQTPGQLRTRSRPRRSLTIAQGTTGATTQIGLIEFLQSGLSGAAVTCGTPIPANCILFSVGCRVVSAITGATSFSVGDSGSGDASRRSGPLRFGTEHRCGIDQLWHCWASRNLFAGAKHHFDCGRRRLHRGLSSSVDPLYALLTLDVVDGAREPRRQRFERSAKTGKLRRSVSPPSCEFRHAG